MIVSLAMIVFKSIGVTATRNGLTNEQKYWAVQWFGKHSTNVLHHGDCIGGDEWLATLFSSKGTYIIAHPVLSGKLFSANCPANDLILPWQDYLVRNRYIVNHSDYMLAFPETPVEQLRSGTWSTIRYAKKQKVAIKIILPNGMEK